MAVLDQIATARDDTFAARVAMCLMVTSVNVANEAALTANHANRLALAQKHIRAQVNVKSVGALVIAYNATIQTAINSAPALRGSNVLDGDLQYAINSLTDQIANAYAAGS